MSNLSLIGNKTMSSVEPVKTLLDIVKVGLVESGFDGLFNECGECGCEVSDLAPGDKCFNEDCIPAYKHTHSSSKDFIMSTKKEGFTDADIEGVLNESSI